jgi:hypothetical protein
MPLAPLDTAPLAGSTAEVSDDATQEPSATQSPLNSRRSVATVVQLSSHEGLKATAAR